MRNIICDDDICTGAPCIAGTRLSCGNIVGHIINSKMGLIDLLSHHSYLEKEDVINCLNYCSAQKCIADKPTNYCQGCALDSREEVSTTDLCDSIGDDLDVEEKVRYWEIADSLLSRMSKNNK